ncbi:MAG: hypothetical protein LBQ48_03575, partial [Oscillospiraceae bacterium]|nr:hypothetical protein [Oscillospiraceae bacterium]
MKKLLAIFCAISLLATLAVAAVFTASAAHTSIVSVGYDGDDSMGGGSADGNWEGTFGQTFTATDTWNYFQYRNVSFNEYTTAHVTLFKYVSGAWEAICDRFYNDGSGGAEKYDGSFWLEPGDQPAGDYYVQISGAPNQNIGAETYGDAYADGTAWKNDDPQGYDWKFIVQYRDENTAFNPEINVAGLPAGARPAPEGVAPGEIPVLTANVDELVANGSGGVNVRGWAGEKGNPTTPLAILVYFGDGSISALTPYTIMTGTADRPDIPPHLSALWGISAVGSYGFAGSVGGTFTGATRVRVFAEGVNGWKTKLRDQTVTITPIRSKIVTGEGVALFDNAAYGNLVLGTEQEVKVNVTVPAGKRLSSDPLTVTYDGGTLTESAIGGSETEFSFTIPAGVSSDVTVTANFTGDVISYNPERPAVSPPGYGPWVAADTPNKSALSDYVSALGQTFTAAEQFDTLLIKPHNYGTVTGWRLTLYKYENSAWAATYLYVAAESHNGTVLPLPLGVQAAGEYYFEISDVTGDGGAGLDFGGTWYDGGQSYINDFGNGPLPKNTDFNFGLQWNENRTPTNNVLGSTTPNTVDPGEVQPGTVVTVTPEIYGGIDEFAPDANGGFYVRGWFADKADPSKSLNLYVYLGEGEISGIAPYVLPINSIRSDVYEYLVVHEGFPQETTSYFTGFDYHNIGDREGDTRVRVYVEAANGEKILNDDRRLTLTYGQPLVPAGVDVGQVF